MPNAIKNYMIPTVIPEFDVAGQLGKGMNAANAMLDNRQRREEMDRRNTINQAISQNAPGATQEGQIDYNALGGAVSSDLMAQGQGMDALNMREQFSKMADADLKRSNESMQKVRPIAFKAYTTFEDLLAKHKGNYQAAETEMNKIWPQYAEAAKKAGWPESDISPTYNHGDIVKFLQVDDMLKDELYNVRKLAITEQTKRAENKAKGKGGAVTSFVQIKQALEKDFPKYDKETVYRLARQIHAEGKYNRQAAAVRLKAAGIGDARIQTFLDGLEGTKEPAAAPQASGVIYYDAQGNRRTR